MDALINLADFERAALARLDDNAAGYYVSGAHDEITLANNHAAYDRIPLHYRVLVDVSRCDTRTTVLGSEIASPVLVAPTAFHGLAHPDAELATAGAAADADTVMILSSLSNTDVEAVVAARGGPVWFQLYVYRDRAATEALVRRVEDAGCLAIVVTVDAPRLGCRERDVRNRFQLPDHLSVKNLMPHGYGAVRAGEGESGLAAYFASLIDPSLCWDDIEWLRSITELPILLKGIVRPDDAARAVDCGAQGIVVSNHGGRQLDTAPATIEVLPAISEAVKGRVPILIDGGVRRGTDVVKALALGAQGVLLGRPILWGLSVGGRAGAARVLSLLDEELRLAMTLCGTPTLASIDRSLVG